MDFLIDGKEKIGFLICIITGLFVLLFGLFFSKVDLPTIASEKLTEYNENWIVSVGSFSGENIRLPAFLDTAEQGDTLVLRKLLPKKIENDTYLFFRASHQKVKAYIDGKEIYRFGWDEKLFYGKSPACAWILVPILKEQAGEALQIELTGVYTPYAGRVNGFFIGDKSSILTYLVTNRIGSIFICAALLILGFGMLVVAFILRSGKATKSLFRLAVLSMLVGVWSACTANVLQVLFEDVYTLLNLEFLTFSLLLPTTLWFLDSFDYYKDRKVMHLFFWSSVIVAVGIHLLQFFNLADYMETVSVHHILMGIFITYLAIDAMKALFRKRASREVRILTVSVIMIVFLSGLDLLKFYFYITIDDGFFTRIGMLLFIIIWASEIIQNMSKLIVKMTQTQLLEILAYQDQMTGLKNRSAFEEKMQECRENDMGEVYIIEFDMNDLKMINDNCGHAIGDQVIKGIADKLKKEFEENGISYRIGGDEFCVIVPKTPMVNEEFIMEKIVRVKAAVHTFGEELNLNLSLASGFSETTGKDDDIDAVYRQADKRMYTDKQQMKSDAE